MTLGANIIIIDRTIDELNARAAESPQVNSRQASHIIKLFREPLTKENKI